MKFPPRPFQVTAVDHAEAFLRNASPGAKQLYAAPTGVGKSVIERLVQERMGPECWIVSPKEEIITGIMDKAGLTGDPMSHSISTPIILRNRLLTGSVRHPKYLVIDESHHHNAETYQQLDLLTGLAPAVGYTATPYRGTPKGTKEFLDKWGEPIWLITYLEAMNEGFISMPSFVMLPLVDDDLVNVKGGEFEVTSITAATVDRLGDMAEHCRQWYNGKWDRATIFAMPSTAACIRMQQELGKRGMPATVINAETPRNERFPIFAAVEAGLTALLHINVVSEGVDLKLRRLVDMSPTLSPVKWLQHLGRITRPTDEPPEYICLAEGTPVLTSNGWKPIETVSVDDEVWDGVDWVHHDGVVCNGKKEITNVYGIEMTPDHKVLTTEGMVEACAIQAEHLSLKLGMYSVSGQLLVDLIPIRDKYAPALAVENTESDVVTSSQANQNDAKNAKLKDLDLAAERMHGVKNILSNSENVSVTLLHDVLIQNIEHSTITVGEAFEYILHGWKGWNFSLSTSLPSITGMSLNLNLTAKIIMDITNLEISDSSLKVHQPLIDETTIRKVEMQEVCTIFSKQNLRKVSGNSNEKEYLKQTSPNYIARIQKSYKRVYDIQNAGPRRRFQAGPLIVSNCTNRNILRHAYILEGVLPAKAVLDAQAAFPKSDRAGISRVLGLEAIGRFKPTTVKLLSGLSAHVYCISVPCGPVVVEYCVLVHPSKEPIWTTKINGTKEDGTRSWGSWRKCKPPSDVTGFSSVAPKALSEKQMAWWKRSAKGFGLDPEQEVTRKNFQALPVLADTGERL